jgi:hypothetical protein
MPVSLQAAPLHILDEDTIDLTEAARILGPKGRPSSLAKVCRAINPGVMAEDGERVLLEAVRNGGCWLTSRQAIARFVARLTEAALSQDRRRPEKPKGPATVPLSARRERELAAVDRDLDDVFDAPPKRRGRKPAKAEA